PHGDRAETYRRMLTAVYNEVKRERPDVRVVGGATAGVPLPYWEKLLANGALQYMDVLSVHPYRYDAAPEGLETDIAELQALVGKYNRGMSKPIWVTEIGWNTRAAQAGDLAIDDLMQAQYLVRSYALLFSANVERVYWYLFRDYNDALMGLVRSDALATPKPAFAAMATMTQLLRHAELAGRDRTPSDIFSICFRRPSGEKVRVMWSLKPQAVAASGVTGVTDMLGGSLGSSGALQLGESPIYVVGDVQGLPEPAGELMAHSQKGFAGSQRHNGWSYGYMRGEKSAFIELPAHGADDWRAVWRGELPFLTVSAKEQHPSVRDGMPIAAVRRWESDRQVTVRIAGTFKAGAQGGDGVGVAVDVNGERRFRKLLGGDSAAPVAEEFELVETVQPGTTVDFVVDPGPAASIDHDGVAVSATISALHEG
ncbi:MAG: glycosyl hydrolase, partial [Opitutaceae bacterium]